MHRSHCQTSGGNQVGSDGQDDVLIIKMTLAFVEYSLCTGQCAH